MQSTGAPHIVDEYNIAQSKGRPKAALFTSELPASPPRRVVEAVVLDLDRRLPLLIRRVDDDEAREPGDFVDLFVDAWTVTPSMMSSKRIVPGSSACAGRGFLTLYGGQAPAAVRFGYCLPSQIWNRYRRRRISRHQ